MQKRPNLETQRTFCLRDKNQTKLVRLFFCENQHALELIRGKLIVVN